MRFERAESLPATHLPCKPGQKRDRPVLGSSLSLGLLGPGASTGISVSDDARRAMVAQAAYLRAERRGFTPGNEVEDWLAAEAEVDALLRAGHSGPPQ